MEQKEVVIIGGGIAGLSASYFLKNHGISSKILEKRETYGGLCDSFCINGYTFDTFAHLTFSTDEQVRFLLEEETEFFTHKPEAYNYYKGQWIRNPVQNNLCDLELEERIDVMKGFIARKNRKIKNYEDWLRVCYGDYFAENFPMKYTRKYWTMEARFLETEWVKKRMYVPSIDEVLRGAFSKETPCVHYSNEMRYPKFGGYKECLKKLKKEADISYNKEVSEINTAEKKIICKDGTAYSYQHLISTVPLTELQYMISDMPKSVKRACNNLEYTSGVLVSIGLSKPIQVPALWFYVYDEDMPMARVYFPGEKSKNNVPDHTSSVQAEIYYSKSKPLSSSMEEITERTIQSFLKMKLFEREDIVVLDIRNIPYANIIFTPSIYKNREIVHQYLDACGIIYAGRFGEWDYLWTDQSLLSGKKAAEKLIKCEDIE